MKNRFDTKRFLKELPLLIAGATLTAVATKYIYDPAGLVTGGVSGLSIITRSVSMRFFGHDFPLWLGSLVFNIPVFVYGMKQLGIKQILRTGFVWLLLTAELYFLCWENHCIIKSAASASAG